MRFRGPPYPDSREEIASKPRKSGFGTVLAEVSFHLSYGVGLLLAARSAVRCNPGEEMCSLDGPYALTPLEREPASDDATARPDPFTLLAAPARPETAPATRLAARRADLLGEFVARAVLVNAGIIGGADDRDDRGNARRRGLRKVVSRTKQRRGR